MSLNTLPLKIIIFLFAIFLLSGCSRDNTDLQEFIAQTRAKHLGSVKPLPQFKPYNNFIYSASDLRDPFEAAFEIETDENTKSNSLRPNTERIKEALENFPLDTLRMVGILEQRNQIWGLIKDPQNLVHRVQVGNYAGQNEGQIVSVTENQIDFIEIVPDGLGGYIERNASLGINTN